METIPIHGPVRQDVLQSLAECAWFRTLQRRAGTAMGADPLDQLVSAATLVRFSEGEALLKRGDTPTGFYVLLKGTVTIWAGDAGAEVGRVGPPSTIGEVGLLLEQPRSATVTAAEEVSALAFDAATFRSLFQSVPEFGYETSRHLAERLREVSEHTT